VTAEEDSPNTSFNAPQAPSGINPSSPATTPGLSPGRTALPQGQDPRIGLTTVDFLRTDLVQLPVLVTRAELVGQARLIATVEQVAQVKQVAQAKPVEQVAQAEPVGQVAQVEPVEQVAQAKPVEQVAQAGPVEQVAPVKQAGPVEQVVPVKQAGPVEQVVPVKQVVPTLQAALVGQAKLAARKLRQVESVEQGNVPRTDFSGSRDPADHSTGASTTDRTGSPNMTLSVQRERSGTRSTRLVIILGL
jgi:hypothetical protein